MPAKIIVLFACSMAAAVPALAQMSQGTPSSQTLIQQCSQQAQPAEREKACGAALQVASLPQDLRARLFFYRGLARIDQQRQAEALPDMDEALKLDGEFWPASWVRADTRGGLRDYPGAAADWSAVARRQPAMATPLVRKAIMLDYALQPDEALAAMAAALDKARDDEERAELYYHRGIIHEDTHRWQEAVADYTRSLQLKDDQRQAYYGRGRVNLLRGDAAAAIADFDKAASIKPGDGYVALWQYIARSRAAGRESTFLKDQRSTIDVDKWPGPVVRAMLGEITPAAATAGPVPLPWDEAGKAAAARCEVEFFLAQQHLIRGERAKALARFEAAVGTGVVEFIEYRAAQYELKRLRP